MEEEGFSFFCFTRKVAVGRQGMTIEDVDDGTAPVTDHRFGEVQEVGHVHNIIQLVIINAIIDGGQHEEPENYIVMRIRPIYMCTARRKFIGIIPTPCLI